MPDVLPWILAATAIGLWLGERGRRLDAQRREGVLKVDPPRRAVSIPPSSQASGSVMRDTEDAKERFVAECVAEGHSQIAAEREWEILMGRSQTGQDGAWEPNL